MTSFAAAINYLPHDHPMVLVDKVLAVTEQTAMCQVIIDQTGILAPFLNQQNELPAWFAIEMMAQTIGVWRGWHASQTQNKIKLGLLLGSRNFKTNKAAYPLNGRVKIFVELILQDSKLASFDCQLILNEELVAEAKLNVYQPDNTELNQLMRKG